MNKSGNSNFCLSFSAGLICVLLSIISLQAPAGAQEKKEYVIGFHFSTEAGFGASQWFNLADSVLDSINQEYGYNASIKKFADGKEIEEAFLEGSIDGMLLRAEDAIGLRKRGGDYWTFITFMFNKNPWESYCLWENKKNALKDISEIEGKPLMCSPIQRDLLSLRDHLSKNGIDKPLWKAFSSFKKPASTISGLMAVSVEKADFFWALGDNYYILDLINPGLKSKLSAKSCSETVYSRPLVVLNKKTVNETDYIKIKKDIAKAFRNFKKMAKKYPRLQFVANMKRMIKVEVTVVEEGYFDHDIKLYRESEKNGWLKEADFILKKLKDAKAMQEVEIIPDKEDCENICDGLKNKKACVDKCMK